MPSDFPPPPYTAQEFCLFTPDQLRALPPPLIPASMSHSLHSLLTDQQKAALPSSVRIKLSSAAMRRTRSMDKKK